MRATSPGDVAGADNSLSVVSWRSWHGLTILLLTVHAALAWLGRAPGIVTREDDARYLLLARALKAGTYRELWSPGQPAHHMYPPGYPALLAAWTSIGGEQFNWLIVLQILLSVGTLILTFSASRLWMPPMVVLCSLAIAAINPWLLHWAGEVASEAAVAFLVALAIWAHSSLAPGARRTTIMTVAAFAAPFFRIAGVVLPVALVADWLWRRRVRSTLLGMGAFALVTVPLLWWTLRDPGAVGNSYAADLTFSPDARVPMAIVFLRRIIANALFYPTKALPWLIPLPTVPGTRIDNAIDAVLVVAGLGVGMFCAFKRLRLAVMTLLACAGLFLIWPWQEARFLLPFLPFVVLLFLFGVHQIAIRFNPRFARAAVVATAAVVSIVAARETGMGVREFMHCDRGGAVPDSTCITAEERGFFRALRFVADSLPEDAHVLAANAATVNLYTGRQAVRALTVAMLDSAHFWPRLHDLHIGYIVLGALHFSDQLVARRLQERCNGLRLMSIVAPHTFVFQITPGDESPSRGHSASGSNVDGTACATIHQYLEAARDGHWILATDKRDDHASPLHPSPMSSTRYAATR